MPEGGFCCNAHRQAHYRAYKKYIEAATAMRNAAVYEP